MQVKLVVVGASPRQGVARRMRVILRKAELIVRLDGANFGGVSPSQTMELEMGVKVPEFLKN